MPGIFPTGRRGDSSLMSSLIAGRLPSYESHNHCYTRARAHAHTSAHIAVMNYRVHSLKPWPYTSPRYVHRSFCVVDRCLHTHLTQIHTESNATWHIPSPAVLLNPRRHPPENRPHSGRQYIDAVQEKTWSPALPPDGVLDVVLECDTNYVQNYAT